MSRARILTLVKKPFMPLVRFQQKHPFVFNVSSCGVFGFAGDYFCQWLEHHLHLKKLKETDPEKYQLLLAETRQHDYKRSTEMGASHTMIGPILHFWYKFLDARWPGNSIRTVAIKCFADYSFAVPYYILFFGVLTAIRRDKTFDGYLQDLKDKIPLLLVIDAVLWPMFQSVNFYFLPPSLRVVGTKFSELFFDTLLSYIAHNDLDLEDLVRGVTGQKSSDSNLSPKGD